MPANEEQKVTLGRKAASFGVGVASIGVAGAGVALGQLTGADLFYTGSIFGFVGFNYYASKRAEKKQKPIYKPARRAGWIAGGIAGAGLGLVLKFTSASAAPQAQAAAPVTFTGEGACAGKQLVLSGPDAQLAPQVLAVPGCTYHRAP